MTSTSVLIASTDPGFRRLAGAALARAGNDVRTMTVRPWRVQRVIELNPPDVVVLDVDETAGREVNAHVSGLTTPPGLVLVAEDLDASDLHAIDKWGPVENLVEEVRLAALDRARPHGRARLRLIRGGA